MLVNIGFKMTKAHYKQWWSEPITNEFDKDAWVVIEEKKYGSSEYKIFIREPFDLNQTQIQMIRELMEIMPGTSGPEGIIQLAVVSHPLDEWKLIVPEPTNPCPECRNDMEIYATTPKTLYLCNSCGYEETA